MKYITPFELAERWRLSEGTLRNWRYQGKGPEYVKLGRSVVYPITSVEKFENKYTFRVRL